jgi:hypothetical protein
MMAMKWMPRYCGTKFPSGNRNQWHPHLCHAGIGKRRERPEKMFMLLVSSDAGLKRYVAPQCRISGE